MTVLAVTITDPSPAFDRKSSEVTWLLGAIETLREEIGRGRGTVTSGTILGTSSDGTPNTALGSWTLTSAASNP
jgi:hypothetical protein